MKPADRAACCYRRRLTATIRQSSRSSPISARFAARSRSWKAPARVWAADGTTTRPKGDWESRRLGAAPGAALVEQAAMASREVYAACGIPLGVVIDTDGTGQRESFRRLLHSTVAPLGRIVSEELSRKFEAEISLSFDSLFAGGLVRQSEVLSKPRGRRHGCFQGRCARRIDGGRRLIPSLAAMARGWVKRDKMSRITRNRATGGGQNVPPPRSAFY